MTRRPTLSPRYTLFGWFLEEGDLYHFVPDTHCEGSGKKAGDMAQGKVEGESKGEEALEELVMTPRRCRKRKRKVGRRERKMFSSLRICLQRL